MKKISTHQLANQPLPDQVIGIFDDFLLEVCMNDSSNYLAFQIRYQAYRGVNAIAENKEELCYDTRDFEPNTFIFLVWYKGRPIATIRQCIFSEIYDWKPLEAHHYFGVDIERRFSKKTHILESGSFAVAPGFQGKQSLFARLLLFRTHCLNAAAHQCQHILSMVRSNHLAFYRRFLGMDSICSQPHYVKWANTNVFLLHNHTDQCLEAILQRRMLPYDQKDITRFAHCTNIPFNNIPRIAA
jgi:hypothetical protein